MSYNRATSVSGVITIERYDISEESQGEVHNVFLANVTSYALLYSRSSLKTVLHQNTDPAIPYFAHEI